MTKMTALARERRKKEIAESVRRKKLGNEIRLGLSVDTGEGRKHLTLLERWLS